ncbi:hypothetical protein G6F59_014236 [Rhizopus arrhizus]|nr:hypothetical protein G6F59_014236 [Rhizopus arrhizus]
MKHGIIAGKRITWDIGEDLLIGIRISLLNRLPQELLPKLHPQSPRKLPGYHLHAIAQVHRLGRTIHDHCGDLGVTCAQQAAVVAVRTSNDGHGVVHDQQLGVYVTLLGHHVQGGGLVGADRMRCVVVLMVDVGQDPITSQVHYRQVLLPAPGLRLCLQVGLFHARLADVLGLLHPVLLLQHGTVEQAAFRMHGQGDVHMEALSGHDGAADARSDGRHQRVAGR